MCWHAGRHGGSLKRLRILLVALSIPQRPSRAAWAALSANCKRQRLGGGDGEAAGGAAQRAACGRCERRYSWRMRQRRQLVAASTDWQLWHAYALVAPVGEWVAQRLALGDLGLAGCAACSGARAHTLGEARRQVARPGSGRGWTWQRRVDGRCWSRLRRRCPTVDG